jgi:hypothetical protein
MRIEIFKDGWFNGTKITKKSAYEILGQKFVEKCINRVKENNLKDDKLVALSITHNNIRYDFCIKDK